MNTDLKNAVLATELKAQYDACAKKLLGYKDILARISKDVTRRSETID